MIPKPKNEVFWYDKNISVYPSLKSDISADVVIIGAGMAGLMAGQALIQNGKSVVIVEKDFSGAGASGKTSGFITPDSEIELSSLVRTYGPAKARKIWEFVLSGVEAIRKNIIEKRIACDYQIQDSLFIANQNSASKYPHREHNSRKELGYESRFYEKNDIISIIGSSGYASAVRYPDTFGINSYQYCQGLKNILINAGVRIYEKTPTVSLEKWGVMTPEGAVRAKQIIVAADRFIPELGRLKKEIYHIQTFLAISKPLDESVIKRIFPEQKMMVWDTNLIYNYFRITGDNRVLLGGGDVFYTYARKYSDNPVGFAGRLNAYFRKKFPDLPIEIEYLWPGMLGVSKDLLPIMGVDDAYSNIWYIGGATGLPWAAALGRYAADRILNGRDEFDSLFSPKRRFIIGPKIQRLIGTPISYAVSHGITKYS